MIENPALKALVVQLGEELVFAQVLIRRTTAGYELRQIENRDADPQSLKLAKPSEARSLAQFTSSGAFRPLKTAPTLPGGWRIFARNPGELELALSGFYPGALADWHAAQSAQPPVTDYRSFVDRQSGMYRITAKLTDVQATDVIRRTCGPEHCLKRRLWTVGGLEPDPAAGKSLIPCLEPCAILLESARKAARQALDDTCAESENG